MKLKTLLVLLFFLAGIFFTTQKVQAQALVINPYGLVFMEGDLEYPSISGNFVMSSSGNLMVRATFQLDERSSLIPDNGVNTIAVRLVLDENGTSADMYYIVNIPKTGRFTINYHLNGAGDFFPNGWGIYWKL